MRKNDIETLKKVKRPLTIIDDIYRWAEQGFESIPPEAYDLLKWYGLFHRKQTPGYFMLRMRISNGVLTTQQLRTLAGISRDYGRGVGDFTTRQNIQLRWIEIENVPDIFERIRAAGLTCQQTGMDNYRNVTGCPVAGLDANELLDARQQAIATGLSLLGREFENLPRKFNISISGCRYDCAHAQSNDIGMTPATRRIGARTLRGFNVVVGGALGGKDAHLAEPLDAFVLPEQVTALCRAILTVFRDHGSREKRQQARLKWLLWEWGIPKFRDEVMKVFGENLPGAGQSELWPHEAAALHADHIGVHAQRQAGLSYVGLLVPVGRLNQEQLFELADVADRYGSHEVRLTNDQNVIIPNVPNKKVPALLAEPLLQEWSPHPSGILRGLVTCTGQDYCHFALNDTKGISLAIARELEQRFPDTDKVVRLNVSGCIHACGRHRATELGLMATRVRLENGEIVDGFDLFQGGRLGEEARLGEEVQAKATIDQTVAWLAHEIAAKYGRQEAEAHLCGCEDIQVANQEDTIPLLATA
ncbi:MAG TPA: hypothetical protein VNK95_25490 [Caldilineaceae bacterium]|nr:hypothetical protein [Caldilineaceae bacterium]